MKNLILTAIVALLTGTVNAQTTAMATTNVATTTFSKGAECTWEKTNFDFGTIPQGKPVSVTFSFTNTGDAPLIIASVNPSCGCTTEDYTKEVVAPGKKGYVKLTFNASAVGVFTKTTMVSTNASSSPLTLTFKGTVAAAEVATP